MLPMAAPRLPLASGFTSATATKKHCAAYSDRHAMFGVCRLRLQPAARSSRLREL